MKFRVIESATFHHMTWPGKYPVLNGDTSVGTLVEFEEVQERKIKFAIMDDDELAALESKTSYRGLGYRTESSAIKSFRSHVSTNKRHVELAHRMAKLRK